MRRPCEGEDCMIIVRRVLPIFLLAVLLAGCGGSQEEGQQSSQEETSTTTSATTSEEATSAQGGGGDATSRTVAATEALLATLDDSQREQVSFDFDDDEAKAVWSNYPAQDVPRNGISLTDMT